MAWLSIINWYGVNTVTISLVLLVAGSVAAHSEVARQVARTGDVVHTQSGDVRGISEESVTVFRGIPYAAPPSGDRRWAAPGPVQSWKGIRDALSYGASCPQVARYGLTQASYDEDCLTINVTAPRGAIAAGALKRPVIAWIYGGAFVGGSSALYPLEAMAVAGDAVVVSFNYRLGVFGFMGNPAFAREYDGGYGLEDQRAALRWIQVNIASFGGDPKNVTIAGESAGAASVCMHLIAPEETDGLFAKAIVQSAFCGQHLRTVQEGDIIGRQVSDLVGCPQNEHALTCLRSKSSKVLLEAAAEVSGGDVMTYAPIAGTRTTPEQPLAALKSGRFVQVPLMNGGNRDELRLYVAYDIQAGKPVTSTNYPEKLRAAYGDKAEAVGREYPLTAYSSPGAALGTAMTDFSPGNGLNYCGYLRTAALVSSWTSVYQYEFADRNAPAPFIGRPPIEMGAVHSAELPYQFPGFSNTTDVDGPSLAQAPRALATTMMQYWTSFAATGQPKASRGPTWPKFVTSDDVMRLEPGNLGLFAAAVEHHCSFWQQLYPGILTGN